MSKIIMCTSDDCKYNKNGKCKAKNVMIKDTKSIHGGYVPVCYSWIEKE